MQVTMKEVSPLVLSDRLLTLAQDADRAGLRSAAERLLDLAGVVLELKPKPRRQRRAVLTHVVGA